MKAWIALQKLYGASLCFFYRRQNGEDSARLFVGWSVSTKSIKWISTKLG